GSGNWATPSNWSTGSLPGSGDDVAIPALGSGVTITHSTGTDTVHSITSGSNVTLSGGTLGVSSSVQMAAGTALTLQGGTLANATLPTGSQLAPTTSGGTLDGVTINSDFQVAGNSSVTVKDGLTLNGT